MTRLRTGLRTGLGALPAGDGSNPFEPSHAAALRRLDAVDLAAYARSRNALDGAATQLSPYLTHGVLTMHEATARLAARYPLRFSDKLVFEFAWREFFHHVWGHHGDTVLHDLRDAALWPGRRADTLPADVREGRTGVPAIDAAVRQLYATGHLHNHARMWLASYVVHLRKVHWRAGADWLYGHLLDGDVPSNHLSWQWVAGTFSSKPYLFNADNVARHAPRAQARVWASEGTAIDQSYEALDDIARHRSDIGPESGPESGLHAGVAEPELLSAPPDAACGVASDWPVCAAQPIELVHAWSLHERPPGGAYRLGVVHLPAHAALPWSAQRWRWVMARMRAVTDAVWVGDLGSIGLPTRASATFAPMPGYDTALSRIATMQPAPRLLPNPAQPCRSFSAFYTQVQREAGTLQACLAAGAPAHAYFNSPVLPRNTRYENTV